MADPRAYDLMVLIDADLPEERRTQILDSIKKEIDSGDGELKGDVDWGVRKLAFEIQHRGDAYYHLFQLEAGSELLKQLQHNLAIDDGVLRHRIIHLPKGPSEKLPRPTPSAPRPAQEESPAEVAPAEAAPAEPAEAAPAEPAPADAAPADAGSADAGSVEQGSPEAAPSAESETAEEQPAPPAA
jgi:small subunit ribosomal protein S6